MIDWWSSIMQITNLLTSYVEQVKTLLERLVREIQYLQLGLAENEIFGDLLIMKSNAGKTIVEIEGELSFDAVEIFTLINNLENILILFNKEDIDNEALDKIYDSAFVLINKSHQMLEKYSKYSLSMGAYI